MNFKKKSSRKEEMQAVVLGALLILAVVFVAGIFVPEETLVKKMYVELFVNTKQYNYALKVASILDADVELSSCSNNEFGDLLPAEKTGAVCFITGFMYRDYEYMRTEREHALFTFDNGIEMYNIVAKVQPGEDYWEMTDRVMTKVMEMNLPGVTSIGSSPIKANAFNSLVEMGIPQW